MSSHYHFTIFLIIIGAATAAITSGQQTVTVDVSITLNVGTLTSSSYKAFLKSFTTQLGATYSRHVPVLPLYNEANPRWFDVVLKTSKSQVTVRGRRDNLYVRGYQMQNQRWMEFGRTNDPVHLIPGSTFLGFGDSYADMENIARLRVTEVSLTKQSFIDAVEKLAVSTVSKDRAKALIIVAQMVAEASRFVDVSNYFASNLNSGSSNLPNWMRVLQNDWGRFSSMVLFADAFPCYVYRPQTINGVVMRTVADLRNKFSIMLRDPKTLKSPC